MALFLPKVLVLGLFFLNLIPLGIRSHSYQIVVCSKLYQIATIIRLKHFVYSLFLNLAEELVCFQYSLMEISLNEKCVFNLSN